jgi:hypothetical protein
MNTYPVGKTISGTTNVTYSNIVVEEQASIFDGIRFSIGYNNYAVTLKANPSIDYTFQLPPTAGISSQVLTTDGLGNMYWGSGGSGGGSGTVVSVSISAPTWLAVSGSPITTSGTRFLILGTITFSPTSTGTGSVVLNSSPFINGLTTLQNLAVNNTNNVPVAGTAINALFPTMTPGPRYIFLGREGLVNNSVVISFNYVSSGSTSNFMALGLYGANQVLIYPGSTFITPASGSLTAFQIACSTIIINSTSTNSVTLDASAAASPYSFRLPITAGSVGQVLTSQGASTMTWTTVTGGTITNVSASGPSNLGIVVTNPTTTPTIVFTPLITGTGNFALSTTPTIATPNFTGAVNLLATTRFSLNCLNLTTPTTSISCGSSLTDRNSFLINFNYVSNSSNNNYTSLGNYGADTLLLYPTSATFTIPSTGCTTSNVFRANLFQSSAGNRAFNVSGVNPSILLTNTASDVAEIGVASALSSFVTGAQIGDLCLSAPTGKRLMVGGDLVAINRLSIQGGAFFDYQEGSWTPTVNGGAGSPPTINYVTQLGTWSRCGKMVTVSVLCVFTYNSFGPAVVKAYIGGLPLDIQVPATMKISPNQVGFNTKWDGVSAPVFVAIPYNTFTDAGGWQYDGRTIIWGGYDTVLTNNFIQAAFIVTGSPSGNETISASFSYMLY